MKSPRSGAAAFDLLSYASGGYPAGDSLDYLYNIGGTGTANQLVSGLLYEQGTASFTVSCTASSTVDTETKPYSIRGLVIADSESLAQASGETPIRESISGTAAGVWNVVEVRKNLATTNSYVVTKSQSGANQTILLGPGNDNRTAAVSFLKFATPASTVSMNFAVRGGGKQAIAIGILAPYADFSDAPLSYGTAMHVVQDLEFQSDGIALNTPTNINTAAFTVGGLLPPSGNFLGTRGPDTEQSAPFSADARGDDIFPSNNTAEENAWPTGGSFDVLAAGTSITRNIVCNGTGFVAGWIDFNRNGTFDNATERAAASCTGGAASLSWNIPSDLTKGDTFVRLRYATVLADIANPTGIAGDGEVEDHRITIPGPALRITKTSNATGGVWNVNQIGATYTLTVHNDGPVATAALGAPKTITVKDRLPDHIDLRTGDFAGGDWSCNFGSLPDITCTTNAILTAVGSAGSSSSIVLPVSIPEDFVGTTAVNYASVGGGSDPNNGGIAPTPGLTCTDSAHCANHTVTILWKPELKITKSSSFVGSTLTTGTPVTFTFLVENTGNVRISDVEVTDVFAGLTWSGGNPNKPSLNPGQSATYTALYTIQAADALQPFIINTATAKGLPPPSYSTTPIESPPSSVTLPPTFTASIELTKTATLVDVNGNGMIEEGDEVHFGFALKNNGQVKLDNVKVIDRDPLVVPARTGGALSLESAATDNSYKAVHVLTQSDINKGTYTNVAYATGTPIGGRPDVQSLDATATVTWSISPSLTIEKSGVWIDEAPSDGIFGIEDRIDYTFVVKNMGNVRITDIAVNDPLLIPAPSGGASALDPGQSTTFTGSYKPTNADANAGTVTNRATATGKSPNGDKVTSPEDSVSIPTPPLLSLAIVKAGSFVDSNGDGFAGEGDTIRYEFDVTNTGNQTMALVKPEDPGPKFNGIVGEGTLSAFDPPFATIETGKTQRFVATYQMTRNDAVRADAKIDAVTNEAHAKGYSVTGVPHVTSNVLAVLTLPTTKPEAVVLTKQALTRQVRRGEQIGFRIELTNNSPTELSNFKLSDTVPSGFRFVDGSARLDGAAVTPSFVGNTIEFAGYKLASGQKIVIELRLLALATAAPGVKINVVDALSNTLTPFAIQAQAGFEVIVEGIFDCSDIIGKVFDDRNQNGYQDKGELGLPGSRVVTARGVIITSDQHGRFSIPCAAIPDARIGSNFILKLDERSLPTGYDLTTENPEVARLTAGKMVEINFGAALGREVRFDLDRDAFVRNDTTPIPQLIEYLPTLIDVLVDQRAVLQLGYLAQAGDSLAEARVEGVRRLIEEMWRARPGPYALRVEVTVEWQ